jgi:hypothetical protein
VNNLLAKAMCVKAFRFSVSYFCNKSVNNICEGINKSSDSAWHLRLCHLNFGSMSQMFNLNLIPDLSIIEDSNCQSCVKFK